MSKKQWWERRPPTKDNPVLCWIGNLPLRVEFISSVNDKGFFVDLDNWEWVNAEPVISIDQYTYWGGGECPVSPDTVVDIIYRDRSVWTGEAGLQTWEHDTDWFEAENIIAYRIHVD